MVSVVVAVVEKEADESLRCYWYVDDQNWMGEKIRLTNWHDNTLIMLVVADGGGIVVVEDQELRNDGKLLVVVGVDNRRYLQNCFVA